MITVKNKASIASISELRSKSKLVLKSMKDHPVILQRHNKPLAVLMDYKSFETLDAMLDYAEDYILGRLAARRERQARSEDYVDIDEW